MQEQLAEPVRRRKRPLSGIEKRRNAAIDRAVSINPITRNDSSAAPLLRLAGTTSAAEFCSMSPECKKQADRLNRTPHLLVADPANPYEFVMVAIGRRAPVAPERITAMCWIDIRGGVPILVPENTLVYWK